MTSSTAASAASATTSATTSARTTATVTTAPTAHEPRCEPVRRGRKPDQAAARDREVRSTSGVSGLLARRPELRGVLRTADWLEETTRWSA